MNENAILLSFSLIDINNFRFEKNTNKKYKTKFKNNIAPIMKKIPNKKISPCLLLLSSNPPKSIYEINNSNEKIIDRH